MKLLITTGSRPVPMDMSLIDGVLRYKTGTLSPDPIPAHSPMRGPFAVGAMSTSERTLELESLRDQSAFGDHACFTLYDRSSANADHVHPLLLTHIHNAYAQTRCSKASLSDYHASVTQVFPLLCVLVPFSTSPIDEWAIVVSSKNSALIQATGDLHTQSAPGLDAACKSFFPLIRFDAHSVRTNAAGESILNFLVTEASGAPITTRECEVYLETTAGTLTQRRVITSSGRGSVMFYADRLPAGSIAKVKCGFKYFSGTDDCHVSVA